MINKLCNKYFKLNRKKSFKIRTSIAIMLLLSIFTGALTAYAQDMNLINLIIDGNSKYYRTSDISVSDFLKKNKIELKEKDIIDKELDFFINQNTTIYIDRAENIIFNIKGEEKINFISNAKNIEEAILEYQKETGRSFKLADGQNKDNRLIENMVINIIPYKEKISTKQEKIPFETIYQENPNLEIGKEIIKINGEEGIKEIKIKEIYLEDELISSNQISDEIKKQPINKIIEKGTKKPVQSIKTNEGDFNYKKKISMRATAYTADFESTGKRPGDRGYGVTASGMKAKRGVVAVDTRVIPFGTKLYIDGYGYAVAGDTGSAIKGNKIDVFVNTSNEAKNWGVRNVDVYILE